MTERDNVQRSNHGYRSLFSQKKVVYAILGILTAGYLVHVLFMDSQGAVLSVFSDDAFYYFKIAKNITSGAGCTFDGIAPTNGFHPLWMLYNVLVYQLANGGLLTPLIVILVTGGLLAFASLVLIYRLVDRFVAPGLGSVAVVLALLPNLLTAMINGLETGLQILLVLLFVYFCYRERWLDSSVQGRRAILIGFFLGVVTLSRLDSVFLIASVLCLTLLAAVLRLVDLKTAIRRTVMICAGFALTMTPYLAWNRIVFGRFMPLSGRVKSSFPALRSPLNLKSDVRIGAMMIVVLILLVVIVSVVRSYRDRDAKKTVTSPLVMLAIASILHFTHIFLFMSWGVYWWHFVLYGITIALALPRSFYLVLESRRRLRYILQIAVILPLIAVTVYLRINEVQIKKRQHEGWMQAALWVRENTEPDAVIAILDAGLFGYYSERKVINLDGKANGHEYYRHLQKGDLTGYLKAAEVDYIANVRVDYSAGFTKIIVRRPNRRSIVLKMMEEWEVYRGPPIPSRAPRFGKVPDSHFIVWRTLWSDLPDSPENF